MRTFVALDQQYHSASVTVRGQLIEADRPGPGGICPNATNIKETAETTGTQTPAPSPNEFIEITPQAVYPGLWRIEVTANGDGCTWQRVCEQRLPDISTSNRVYVFKDACISESGLRNHYDATVPRTMTDFSHYTTGYSPCSWSERWAGDASNWVVRSGSGVGGKELQGDQTADGRRLLSWDEIPVAADVEILTKVMVHTVDPTVMGGRVYARAAGSLGAETGYFSFFAEGTTIGIYKYDDGDAQLVASIPYAYNLGEWYWVRFRVVGNSLKLKVWPDGNTEPPGWGSPNGIEDTNSDLTEPGWVGVGTNYQSDGPYYDWFSVGLNGVSAQSP